MFKDEFQAAFSKVTAPEETYRRVMQMKYLKKKQRSVFTTASKGLVAAVMISLLAVTASAAARDMFLNYFSKQGQTELSQSQMQFIEENTQNILQSQTCNGWTIALDSAISDGMKGYLMLSVTAPEDVDLSGALDDSVYFGSRNDYLPKSEDTALRCESYADMLGVLADIRSCWQDDGDGRNNTFNYILEFIPALELASCDPFAPDTKWSLHWVDFVKGFTEQETLAEGTWDFTFTFERNDTEISLLAAPIVTRASVLHGSGEETMEDVTLVRAILRPFGLTVYYGAEGDPADYSRDSVSLGWELDKESPWYAVLKDGREIALKERGGNPVERCSSLEAETPLVLDEVQSIRLSDGTLLPVPNAK